MSARELRAEARAWRRAAERCAATDLVKLRDATNVSERCTRCGNLDERLTVQMRERLHARWSDKYVATDDGIDQDFRVLACLFLALECEDEARALARREKRNKERRVTYWQTPR